MKKSDLQNLRVGDEVLVDGFDYYEDHDAMMREVVTQIEEDSICTLDYGGAINFYCATDNTLREVKEKTGRNFPEMQMILDRLKEGATA